MKRLLLLLGVLFSLNLYCQNIVSPLDIPLYLSGNFGELRSNHFHSGIDFKTQGVIGKKVKSVKGGFISRISVSPYGYGRAVYIDHPDGTTSVYAHLDHFINKIEQAVLDSQYRKETFAVNLFFTPDIFPLSQGEVFAYSGNTGGSGGPHVHFEFRDTKTEIPFDPLPFFKDKIKDTTPPDIRGIMIFPIDNKGLVNGSTKKQAVAISSDKKGISQTITAWGEIGIGIKAYDRMNETSNIYGVNEIVLKVDGEEVYHSIMDSFSFDDTRYLNSYIDYEDWIENRSFYMKSFTDPGNYLGVNHCLDNGLIHINEERTYKIEYKLIDVYGNKSFLQFNIQGKKSNISEKSLGEVNFFYNKDNYYSGKGIELEIPRKMLYSNMIDVSIDTVTAYTSFAPLYKIISRTPLHSYCPISLEVTKDSHSKPSQYGIVQVIKEKKSWLGGEYKEGKVVGRIRELGDFTIMVDSIPPVITPVAEAKWMQNKKISFKISDDLSGVKEYKGTLDGEFILFEYDAKSKSLFHIFDVRRTKKEFRTLELKVIDGAGNEAVYRKNL